MKILWIFLVIFVASSQAQITCRYAINPMNGRYTCFITIDNANGLDNFQSIEGQHLPDSTDSSVTDIRADGGNTPIFPQIVCRKFSALLYIVISINIGVQRLTEFSFVNCFNLEWIQFENNLITEVHSATLRDNVKIRAFWLDNTRITTLPENIFSNARFLEQIQIKNTPTLNDLPVNIFKDLNNVSILYLQNNRLRVWRPEWTRYMSKLFRLFIDKNYHITEVPRNAINSRELNLLYLDTNLIRSIDYFSFNELPSIFRIDMSSQPVDAIDFNILDKAKSMFSFMVVNGNCASGSFFISQYREETMRDLEPCFEAFDRKVMGEFYHFLRSLEILALKPPRFLAIACRL